MSFCNDYIAYTQERGFLHHLFLQGVEDERGLFVARCLRSSLVLAVFRSMRSDHRTWSGLSRGQSLAILLPCVEGFGDGNVLSDSRFQ